MLKEKFTRELVLTVPDLDKKIRMEVCWIMLQEEFYL